MDTWSLFAYGIYVALIILSFIISFYMLVYFSHNREEDFPKINIIKGLLLLTSAITFIVISTLILDMMSFTE